MTKLNFSPSACWLDRVNCIMLPCWWCLTKTFFSFSGSGNNLWRATNLARSYVANFGLSEKVSRNIAVHLTVCFTCVPIVVLQELSDLYHYRFRVLCPLMVKDYNKLKYRYLEKDSVSCSLTLSILIQTIEIHVSRSKLILFFDSYCQNFPSKIIVTVSFFLWRMR